MSKRIGFIYHSYTGQTEKVLTTAEARLKTKDYTLTLDQVRAVDANPKVSEVTLTHAPKVDDYDLIVLASPVHAFSVPIVMKTYLESVSSFQGKPVMLLVTHHFPFKWLGGKQALNALQKKVEALEGQVIIKHSVEWSSKHREREVNRWVEALEGYLSGWVSHE